jgi:hypothetical protein
MIKPVPLKKIDKDSDLWKVGESRVLPENAPRGQYGSRYHTARAMPRYPSTQYQYRAYSYELQDLPHLRTEPKEMPRRFQPRFEKYDQYRYDGKYPREDRENDYRLEKYDSLYDKPFAKYDRKYGRYDTKYDSSKYDRYDRYDRYDTGKYDRYDTHKYYDSGKYDPNKYYDSGKHDRFDASK